MKDPLAGAPQDWTAFLPWAEEKLRTQPASVPIPASPSLAPPRWNLRRLDDPAMLQTADKTSRWTAPPVGSGALATVGPFRSDQSAPDFVARPVARATPDGKDSLALQVGGFQVRCEAVGSIELTIHAPYGKHIVLSWAKAGSVLVPVESNQKPFTVRVLTDGFAEWQGTLNRISIVTDGHLPEKVVEIRSLRFMPRTRAYPDPVGLKRVRLGHEIRTAIYAHCPAEITFRDVPLPAKAKLHVGLGHVSGTGPDADTGGATETAFEVLVAHDGGQTVALTQRIDIAEAWIDVGASLADWAGQRVTLTLRCSSAAPETVAFWANPIVYEPVDDPPVLVLYLIDTVASEHVNFHGYVRQTMPRLTGLAARGVWFSRMFSNSSRTIESIPDLMLSMPAECHGVHHNSTPAPAGLVTIAEALRAAGFATVSLCTNVNAGPRQGMDQGFDTFVDKISYYWTVNADRTIPLEETLAWIAQHRDRPMFLYIHTAEPHAPYTPPEGFGDRFDPGYSGSFTGIRFHHARDPRDVAHVAALYDEELVYADARLGLFLDALQQEGLLEKAHFLVTSDHGEEFLQHGHWEHGLNLHNEQTRVPLVAYGPTFANGVRVDTPAQLLDVMPTILEMFELPQPYTLHGASLLPLLCGTGDSGTPTAEGLREELGGRDVYASNHNYRITRRLIEYSLIEQGRWKLVFGLRPASLYPGGSTSRFLLFDLASDPRERRNVIYTQQPIARRLIEKLVCWRLRQHPYDPGSRAPTEIDPAHMRELEALGYVGGDDDEPNDSD